MFNECSSEMVKDSLAHDVRGRDKLWSVGALPLFIWQQREYTLKENNKKACRNKRQTKIYIENKNRLENVADLSS